MEHAMTMTNDERLLSYIKSAKSAILDVTDGTIGTGDDPLAFVIACFQSQATKIKELSGKHATVQSKWSHERMCLKDAIFRNERRIKELEETIENKACRFNCRTKKTNWMQGYIEAQHNAARGATLDAQEAWKDVRNSG